MTENATAILCDLRRRVAVRIGVLESAIDVNLAIMDDLGMASVEVLDFLIDLEESYPQFDLEDPAARTLRSLNDLANLLAARCG